MQISQPTGSSSILPLNQAKEEAQKGTAKPCLMEMSKLKDCWKIAALPHAYN